MNELQSIKNLLAASQFGENQLWNAQQCADYLGLTRAYALRTVMKNKSFPQPFEIEGINALRWNACEVMQYAVKHRVNVTN
ncbi:MAG: hypothetical protein HOH19_14745 [Kordiimonadaceae bacterium]|nr:hypothetical protein [Kordiimonadaceae bacterium]MBT6033829.1 hypothetical protein [Kordiimonadaceae bacterium]